jgi:hypothetical protein
MNVRLNENIQDLLKNLQDDSKKSTPDINQIIKSGKRGTKKKRESLLPDDSLINVIDEPVQQTKVEIPEIPAKIQQLQKQEQIVVSQTIAEIQERHAIKQIVTETQKLQIKDSVKKRSKIKDKIVTPEINQQVKSEIEQLKNVQLPEDVNYVEVEETVDTALADIPDGSNYDIIDVEITRIEKKDKSGYFKTKVNIKKENIPDQINQIASYVKKQTNGLISPRVCDLRVIGNTNKTQLRGSNLKLSVGTIVFKPDHTKLKVNKGTRFMISIPENYDSTGNLIVYMQESRAKKILEVTAKDFPSINVFNEFIGDRIAEYYFSGYEVTVKKLELRNVDNPLMSLITKIVQTHEYKAKPYVDESRIYAVDFISKSPKNQWLIIQVIESDIKNTYKILAKNSADMSWEYQISKTDVTLNQLLKNFYDILDSCYNKDWSYELNLAEDDNFYYLYDKLNHARLKKALIFLNDYAIDNPDSGLTIKETLSKKDISKAIDKEYDAEAIIGKTDNLDYYILTYLAFQIVAGDKRAGRDYITSQEYYDKYNVKDRRDYQFRDKTVLMKQGSERNYNARIYLFQLEYSVKGKKHVYRNTNWDELMMETQFLSNNPRFPVSKY